MEKDIIIIKLNDANIIFILLIQTLIAMITMCLIKKLFSLIIICFKLDFVASLLDTKYYIYKMMIYSCW